MICVGGYFGVTSVAYYALFFALSGFSQSIGWPSYIAVIGNWFPQHQRGLAFGIWCSCENIGNIGGNILANILVDTFEMEWMSAFLTVGVIVGVFGILNFILLIEHPKHLQISIDDKDSTQETYPIIKNGQNSNFNSEVQIENEIRYFDSQSNLNNRNANTGSKESREKAISFLDAWKIPGVIQYAICITFVKLSTYGILYWLPSYSKYELEYTHLEIGRLSISYDVGVIVGNIVIGKIGDILNENRSLVCSCSLFCGSLCFWYVVFYSHFSVYLMLVIIFFVGFFVHSIFNMIAATAATDLAKGYHHSTDSADPSSVGGETAPENHKAIATLSGILDGSGSFGAAVGSFVIGAIREYSWTGMFVFLACAVLVSSIVVVKR